MLRCYLWNCSKVTCEEIPKKQRAGWSVFFECSQQGGATGRAQATVFLQCRQQGWSCVLFGRECYLLLWTEAAVLLAVVLLHLLQSFLLLSLFSPGLKLLDSWPLAFHSSSSSALPLLAAGAQDKASAQDFCDAGAFCRAPQSPTHLPPLDSSFREEQVLAFASLTASLNSCLTIRHVKSFINILEFWF